jgi:hypothetical protein
VESAVVGRPDGAVRLPAHTGPIGFSPTNQIHGYLIRSLRAVALRLSGFSVGAFCRGFQATTR